MRRERDTASRGAAQVRADDASLTARSPATCARTPTSRSTIARNANNDEVVPSRDRNAAGRNDLAAAQQPPSGFGTYTYDASGNITSIGDATAKDSFLYDELGRQLPEGPAQTFTYDRYGNILTVTTAGDAIVKKLGANANTNQLTRAANDHCQPKQRPRDL